MRRIRIHKKLIRITSHGFFEEDLGSKIEDPGSRIEHRIFEDFLNIFAIAYCKRPSFRRTHMVGLQVDSPTCFARCRIAAHFQGFLLVRVSAVFSRRFLVWMPLERAPARAVVKRKEERRRRC